MGCIPTAAVPSTFVRRGVVEAGSGARVLLVAVALVVLLVALPEPPYKSLAAKGWSVTGGGILLLFGVVVEGWLRLGRNKSLLEVCVVVVRNNVSATVNTGVVVVLSKERSVKTVVVALLVKVAGNADSSVPAA